MALLIRTELVAPGLQNVRVDSGGCGYAATAFDRRVSGR
jgi:hypothetical protein